LSRTASPIDPLPKSNVQTVPVFAIAFLSPIVGHRITARVFGKQVQKTEKG
jgi:hypothetical protein